MHMYKVSHYTCILWTMMLAFKDHLKDEESKLGQICKSGQKCKQHHAWNTCKSK